MSAHQVVFDSDVTGKYGIHHLMNKDYTYVFNAIRELAHLPEGKSVIIPVDAHSAKLVRAKAYVYCQRWGISIATHVVDEGIFVIRKKLKAKEGEKVRGSQAHKSIAT